MHVVVQQKLRTDTKLVQFGLSIQIKADAPALLAKKQKRKEKGKQGIDRVLLSQQETASTCRETGRLR